MATRWPVTRACAPRLLALVLASRLELGCGPEVALPPLVSSQPAAAQTGVPSSAWIVLRFAGSPARVSQTTFQLACGGVVRAVKAGFADLKTVALNPEQDLPPSSSCTVSWAGPAGPASLSFTTLASGTGATVVYDRESNTRLTPWPDAYWLTPDPTTATGLRLAVPVPAATQQVRAVYGALLADANLLDGFSPVGHFVIELSQPALPASLPLTAAASLDPLATVMLFDLDSPDPAHPVRVPFQLRARSDTTFQGVTGHTLVLLPTGPLRSGGRYGLVITRRALSANGQPLAPSGFLANVLAPPGGTSSPAVVRARGSIAGLRSLVLANASPPIGSDDLALALTFVVRSTDRIPSDLAAVRADVFSRPPPAYTITSVQPSFSPGVAAVVHGTWDAPDYREDLNFARDAAGRPVRTWTRPVPFVLALPSAPATGRAPIVMYQHGNPGSAEGEVEWSAGFLGPAGFAVIGFTDISNREVSPTAEGQIQATLFNLLINQKIPDYWAETHAEQIAFVRMIQGLGSLDVLPLSAPDGVPDLDPAKPLGYHGISEGANNGPGILAFLPEIRAAALVVGGARLGEVLADSGQTTPGVFAQLPVFLPGVTPGEIMMGLALFQAAFDAQDAAMKAPFLYVSPVPIAGSARRASVLLQQGLGDTYVPNNATESLALAFGRMTHLGPLERPVPGLVHAATTLRANVDALTTAALVQYVPFGYPGKPPSPGCEFESEGHFCPQIGSAAVAQRVAFLQSALGGGAPTVTDTR